MKKTFASIKYENLANTTGHKVLNKMFSFPFNHFHFRKIKLWKLITAV